MTPDIERQIAEKLRAQEERRELKTLEQMGVPKPRKYRNVRTIYKSIQGFERMYDSKKEAEFAARLDTWIRHGTHYLLFWLPQVPLPLPGGVTYRADFMGHFDGGKIRFFDVKGRDTQASINKRKQIKALYGIEVEIV